MSFAVFSWYVIGMFWVWLTYPRHNFRYVSKVCFGYFKDGMFWVHFRYINFVPKMILNGMFLVCQR